jgi:hypothetical protein
MSCREVLWSEATPHRMAFGLHLVQKHCSAKAIAVDLSIVEHN